MEKRDKLEFLAFKKLKDELKEKENLEEVFDKGISLSENSLQYEEMDFILAREISGEIREDSALKKLTLFIVQTYKKCKSDYEFAEVMKPRRELTIPSEGKNYYNIGVYNEGRDNIDYNLIVWVNDVIQGPKEKYEVIDIIGKEYNLFVFRTRNFRSSF
jgi:hypothetical protein